MAEWYYKVTYTEHENGQIINSDEMLIRSTTPLDTDRMKRFIRGQVGKPAMVITLPVVTPIDKETFVTLGGSETAPWYGKSEE